MLATGEVVAMANGAELQSRDGTRLQIADSAAPIRDNAGTVVGVVLVFSDVTARYVAQRELGEAYTFVRQIIDNLPVGLYVLDLEGRFVEWNPAMEVLSGRSRAGDCSGRRWRTLSRSSRKSGTTRSRMRSPGPFVASRVDKTTGR